MRDRFEREKRAFAIHQEIYVVIISPQVRLRPHRESGICLRDPLSDHREVLRHRVPAQEDEPEERAHPLLRRRHRRL